jgi:NhaP-type Na+/H+ or K+/H+ antiporter
MNEGAAGAIKEYPSPRVKVPGFMVENVQWEQIRTNVGEIEGARAPEWLLTLASVAIGIAVSAVIAYLVLPSTTSDQKTIAPGVRPALLASTIAGFVVGFALAGLYAYERKKLSAKKGAVQREMDTIKTAWQQVEQIQSAPAAPS